MYLTLVFSLFFRPEDPAFNLNTMVYWQTGLHPTHLLCQCFTSWPESGRKLLVNLPNVSSL